MILAQAVHGAIKVAGGLFQGINGSQLQLFAGADIFKQLRSLGAIPFHGGQLQPLLGFKRFVGLHPAA